MNEALRLRHVADDHRDRNAGLGGAVDAVDERVGVAGEDHEAGGLAGDQFIELACLRGSVEIERPGELGLDAEQLADILQAPAGDRPRTAPA